MDGWFRTVVNCATREKDLEWMTAHTKGFDISLTERPEMAMVAVQGPEALGMVQKVRPEAASLSMVSRSSRVCHSTAGFMPAQVTPAKTALRL